MPEIALAGCRSRPLAGYLKSIGIARLLSRQLEGDVRVRWRHDTFEIASDLDEDGLRAFWLEQYVPTPVLSPWNGGSGFYPRGNTTAVKHLTRIERSGDPRFARYRELIARTRDLLDGDEKPDGPTKERLVRTLRRTWPDEALEWLDAAIVQVGDSLAYPPVLGSGGNDGRFDFSSNYMGALGETLLDGRKADAWLDAALFAADVPVARTTLAHFERDDSPVKAPVADAPSLGNPWDLILAIEGTLAFTPVAARRHGSNHRGSLVAPFTARPTAAGYGSAVDGESGRAELWLPLWSAWATYPELSLLIRESRAEVRSGSRPRTATSGLDFARAAGDLGVARGITAFERYALLERAGQSTLAVPAGRVSVRARPAVAALRSLDPWWTRLQSFLASDDCPRGVKTAGRRLERALFDLADRGRPSDACAALEALGAMEHALARSAKAAQGAGIRPVFGADAAAWLRAADDGSAEFAIGTALASLADPPNARRSPSMRDYLHGTLEGGTSFDEDRRHVVGGTTLVDRLSAIHSRRHQTVFTARSDEETGTRPDHPSYAFGVWSALSHAERLAMSHPEGGLDEERILRLLLGMAVLTWRGAQLREIREELSIGQSDPSIPSPAFRVLALAWARPQQVLDDAELERFRTRHLGPRPGWAAKLHAGRSEVVIADAVRRLRLAGLPPRPSAADLSTAAPEGARLAAALLLVVQPRDLHEIRRRLIEPRRDEEPNEAMEDAS